MKFIKVLITCTLCTCMLSVISCGSMSNTSKGAAIGAGSGAAVGAGIGALAGRSGSKGKTAAIAGGVGAVVGGAAGALIGKKMDQQAAELQQEMKEVKVEVVNDGEAIRVTFDSGIMFDTGKANLSNSAKQSLDKFAESLKRNPDTDISIEGHTDNTGSREVNERLSKERAETVATYLAQKGVDRQRVTTVGYAFDRPVADNTTTAGRAANRRVEAYILPNQKMLDDASSGTLK